MTPIIIEYLNRVLQAIFSKYYLWIGGDFKKL